MVEAEYFSINQLIVYSGISERTIRYLLKEGLPHYRIGRRIVRIKRSEFDEWIARYRQEKDRAAETAGVIRKELKKRRKKKEDEKRKPKKWAPIV